MTQEELSNFEDDGPITNAEFQSLLIEELRRKRSYVIESSGKTPEQILFEGSLTKFECEMIKDWRSLKPDESIVVTKAKAKSQLEGMIERHTRKTIAKGVDIHL